MSDENNKNRYELEQDKENQKSPWKKFFGLKQISCLILILFAFIWNSIISYANDGKFEYLKNSYGKQAVVLNDNEIFLPCWSFGNMSNPEIMPAQIYNIKEKNLNH